MLLRREVPENAIALERLAANTSENFWLSAELLRDLEAGELSIAPAVSIARRIIESWYGGELPDSSAEFTVPS